MSVRVNLLPDDLQRKERANQRNLWIVGGFALLFVLLAFGSVWQLGRVGDARAVLDEEEEVAQQLQGEIAELDEYAAIQAAMADADSTVSLVFAGEIGVAGILQDLATVMPEGTELSELDFAATPDAELATPGELTITGRTIDRHAPGLERLLLELDKVAAFRSPYFGSAAVDNDEAVAFDVTVQLGPEVLTHRYDGGIPEVLR